MTQAENDADRVGLDEDAAAMDARHRPRVVAAILISIALVIAADLVVDAMEGSSFAHLALELAVMSAALAGAAILVRDLARARARTRALARDLAASHRDVQRYRDEAAELVQGLGEAIEGQLDRWQLTEAEKEVAVLLLKGLSHKEVAEVRGTSERTARGQAREVYRKAGLDSRAALSAFFLEDLLPPAPRREAASS